MKEFPLELDALLTVVAAVLDADGVLLQANEGFTRLLPAKWARPVGTVVARFFIQPVFAELVAAQAGGQVESYRGLMTIGDRTGKTRTLIGRVWRTAGGLRVLAEYDIAELERVGDAMLDLQQESSVSQHDLARDNVALKQREVQSLAASLTDALTGVGNRRRLDQALAAEIGRVARSGGTLSAIMADLDHFKQVNDLHGHGAGDKVLAAVGELFRSLTRVTDIVARFGGEEFIVLMPMAGLAQAAAKAEQLRGKLAGQRMEPLPGPVTSSFGVVELLPGENSEAFLRRLDAALYRAKANGRNRVFSISDDLI